MGCGSSVKKEVKRGYEGVEKTVKKAGSDIEKTGKTIGEQATKAGTAALATASDPGAWLMYAVDPISGTFLGAQKATQTYEALNEAEKEEFRAKAEQEMARNTERKAMIEQEKMVSDKAKAAAASAKERATRMGQGRRGLLYQGKESGVTSKSTVLGG